MLACCTCTGELGMEGWQIWTDHPIREQYEVVMDLGEGGFAQVSCRMHAAVSTEIVPNPKLCLLWDAANKLKVQGRQGQTANKT